MKASWRSCSVIKIQKHTTAYRSVFPSIIGQYKSKAAEAVSVGAVDAFIPST